MELIPIPLTKGQWLSEALKNKGYTNIPTNTILKKTLPGLGATYMEINPKISKRHSIIIEPNVPVIIGKTEGKPELLGVYGDGTEAKKRKIEKYLKDDDIKYKKLITTPESYHLIKEVIQNRNVKFNLYEDFFCLFDECEKLIQDIDYRENITQPISDFFLFDKKAFVSATTLDMTQPEFEKQNFQILEIEPDYNYKKDIELIITNTYEVSLLEKWEELAMSKCICVFLNKTDSIDKIIDFLKIKNQSKIFCSDRSVKKLKEKGYTDITDKIDLPLAKYNFFTCRFFSAVDIVIKEKPDLLILTVLKDAEHTMIDPFTESIQIYGRFRKKYHGDDIPFNSLTHLTDFNPHFKVKKKDEIDKTITVYKNTYTEHKEKTDNTEDETIKQALLTDLQGLKYTEFLDYNGKYNYFSQDNFYHAERVKGYYSAPTLLEQAYRNTQHFNITKLTIKDEPFNFGAESYFGTTLFKMTKRPTKQIREQIINDLKALAEQQQINPDFDIETHKNVLGRVKVSDKETGELIVDAFNYLGVTLIEQIGYSSPAKLQKAIDLAKTIQKEKDSFHIVTAELKRQYKIGDTLTKNEIKEFLTEIYRLNGINIKISQDTIRNYCQVAEDNNKKPAIFKIKGFLSSFGEIREKRKEKRKEKKEKKEKTKEE